MIKHRPILLLALAIALPARADRIKDIVAFAGDQEWELLGTGLVVGLAGTGDGNAFRASVQSLANALERMNHSVSPTDIRSKNVAMVMVAARVRSYDREGTKLDVRVSSIGDASSLEGGTLLSATLAEVTSGEVVAIAEGAISIGGFNVSAGANNSVQKNHSTVGRIPNGARVLRRFGTSDGGDEIGLRLHHPDRNTASWIARVINQSYPGTAMAEDAGYVAVRLPAEFAGDRIGFEAALGKLDAPIDRIARVVVNERTGTIVIGDGVRLSEASIAHGGLTVEIRTSYGVSQPNSFNESGQTVVVPEVAARVSEAEAHVVRLPAMTTVRQVADALNTMGATPRDLIAILQALKESGALQAELVLQ